MAQPLIVASPSLTADPFNAALLALLSGARHSAAPAAPLKVQAAAANDAPPRFSIPAGYAVVEGGPKAKFRANLRAIEILRATEADGRSATPAECLELVRYCGWGGLQQAFRRADGSCADGWEKEVAALESALTDEELGQVRATTTDAFYTPREVVDAIYAGLARLGFKGGRVLDPATGTGHFVGMAPSVLREAMRFTTVEIDPLSASIASSLYPEARVRVTAFQDFAVRHGSFDAAVGNTPFGTLAPFDALNQDLRGFSIHNYFVAKSLRALAFGGLLAMVVSRHLMDKQFSAERRWMTERARLLGAIRLPNNTFAAGAGTSVVADILFLQRLSPGEEGNPEAWEDLANVPDANDGEAIPVNEYFAKHPHMMLGTMQRESGQFKADEPTLAPIAGAHLADQLAGAIAHLPANVAAPALGEGDAANPVPPETIHVPHWSHFFSADGSIWRRLPDEADEPVAQRMDLAGRDFQRLRALIDLRDDLRALMAAEAAGESDATIARRRAHLNAAYDAFVASFGYVNSQANVTIFRDDADAFLVRALEADYQRLDAEAAARAGHTLPKGRSTVEVCSKAAIFSVRVLHPERAPRPESPADALAVSLNQFGRINPDAVADMMKRPWDELARELGDLIFLRPDDRQWVMADEYLSGNVKKALAEARRAAAGDLEFERNVRALEKVQPADLPPGDIFVNLGSPWVPAETYRAFATEVLGRSLVKVAFAPSLGRFATSSVGAGHSRFGIRTLTAAKIFAKAINREAIIVTKIVDDGRSVTDHEATESARQAADVMNEEFVGWVWSDADRRQKLARIYNDTFNTDVPRRYDGAHLTFPGKVSDDVIRLRKTQVDGVWRMIQDGVTLLDHEVGAGKTFTLIAAFMEMRRMGLVRKPMVTVPNSLVGQWATDVVRLYPAARVLAVTEQDFEKSRRKMLFARIATGDWDMVIVAHSQFSRIGVPAEFEKRYLAEQVEVYDQGIENLKAGGADGRSIKQAEKSRKAIQERLKAKIEGITRDNRTAALDDMGIDAIAVDEADMFKNLGFLTRKRNVSGLGNPQGSFRAEDLYMKVRWLQCTRTHAAVYFLTGTPLSNSIVELYSLQRYLAADVLAERGIQQFDAWANNYAEESVSFELDSSAQGLKPKTVLKRFRNVPEMLSIYTRFADTVTNGDLRRIYKNSTGTDWPIPKLHGGAPEHIVVPAGRALERYINEEIIPRMQAVSGESGIRPDPSVDNMLKITNDARLAALDVRLRVPDASDDPGSKVNTAVEHILAIHREWEAQRGTQLVFCDLSTPSGAVAAERAELLALQARAAMDDEEAIRTLESMSPDTILSLGSKFSVYDDLRAKLIAGGVAPHEVAFIHDARTTAQRKVMFDRMNRGDLRILIGSTLKMGAGMNVQARLVALSHLDGPWRPRDLTQREGRLLRQGNIFYAADPENFRVRILRFCTARTYDARMWQLIERKASIVDQLRSGGDGMREVDDIVNQAASAAALKAECTGNPLILEQVELEANIKRLGMLQRAHVNRVYDAERVVAALEDHGGPEARYTAQIALATKAEALLAEHPRDVFSVVVNGVTYREFKDGANALALCAVDAINGAPIYGQLSADLCLFRGATVVLRGSGSEPRLRFLIPDLGKLIGDVELPLSSDGKVSASGLVARMNNAIDRLSRLRERAEDERQSAAQRLADMRDLASLPFRQEAELAEARARLKVIMQLLIKDHSKKKVKPATVDEVTAESDALAEAA